MPALSSRFAFSVSRVIHCDASRMLIIAFVFRVVPTEFTSVTFPVKALKLILRDVKLGGESATLATQVPAVESDDEVCLRPFLLL